MVEATFFGKPMRETCITPACTAYHNRLISPLAKSPLALLELIARIVMALGAILVIYPIMIGLVLAGKKPEDSSNDQAGNKPAEKDSLKQPQGTAKVPSGITEKPTPSQPASTEQPQATLITPSSTTEKPTPGQSTSTEQPQASVKTPSNTKITAPIQPSATEQPEATVKTPSKTELVATTTPIQPPDTEQPQEKVKTPSSATENPVESTIEQPDEESSSMIHTHSFSSNVEDLPENEEFFKTTSAQERAKTLSLQPSIPEKPIVTVTKLEEQQPNPIATKTTQVAATVLLLPDYQPSMNVFSKYCEYWTSYRRSFMDMHAGISVFSLRRDLFPITVFGIQENLSNVANNLNDKNSSIFSGLPELYDTSAHVAHLIINPSGYGKWRVEHYSPTSLTTVNLKSNQKTETLSTKEGLRKELSAFGVNEETQKEILDRLHEVRIADSCIEDPWKVYAHVCSIMNSVEARFSDQAKEGVVVIHIKLKVDETEYTLYFKKDTQDYAQTKEEVFRHLAHRLHELIGAVLEGTVKDPENVTIEFNHLVLTPHIFIDPNDPARDRIARTAKESVRVIMHQSSDFEFPKATNPKSTMSDSAIEIRILNQTLESLEAFNQNEIDNIVTTSKNLKKEFNEKEAIKLEEQREKEELEAAYAAERVQEAAQQLREQELKADANAAGVSVEVMAAQREEQEAQQQAQEQQLINNLAGVILGAVVR